MRRNRLHLSEEQRFDQCRVAFQLRLEDCRLQPEDVELTETPGYWREKRERGGVKHTLQGVNQTHWAGVRGSVSRYWFWMECWRRNLWRPEGSRSGLSISVSKILTMGLRRSGKVDKPRRRW